MDEAVKTHIAACFLAIDNLQSVIEAAMFFAITPTNAFKILDSLADSIDYKLEWAVKTFILREMHKLGENTDALVARATSLLCHENSLSTQFL